MHRMFGARCQWESHRSLDFSISPCRAFREMLREHMEKLGAGSVRDSPADERQSQGQTRCRRSPAPRRQNGQLPIVGSRATRPARKVCRCQLETLGSPTRQASKEGHRLLSSAWGVSHRSAVGLCTCRQGACQHYGQDILSLTE